MRRSIMNAAMLFLVIMVSTHLILLARRRRQPIISFESFTVLHLNLKKRLHKVTVLGKDYLPESVTKLGESLVEDDVLDDDLNDDDLDDEEEDDVKNDDILDISFDEMSMQDVLDNETIEEEMDKVVGDNNDTGSPLRMDSLTFENETSVGEILLSEGAERNNLSSMMMVEEKNSTQPAEQDSEEEEREKETLVDQVNAARERTSNFTPGTLGFFEDMVGLHARGINGVAPSEPESPLYVPWLKEWQAKEKKTCVRLEPLNKLPIIFVASNRRSGTHMVMDMLHNIFPGDKLVLKTNHVIAAKGQMDCTCRNWLTRNVKTVHIHRNLIDVIVSYFYYRRRYDGNFRRLEFDEFVAGSGTLLNLIKQWVQTTHSWYTQPNVFHVQFDDVYNMTPSVIEDMSKFLGLDASKDAKAWNRKQWDLVSHAVKRGRGKGKKLQQGKRQAMEQDAIEFIIKNAMKDRQWKKNTLLKCKAEKPSQPSFVPDQVCVDEDGQRSVISTHNQCEIIPRMRKGLGLPRGYLCIPKSCPTDLKQGIFYVDQAGESDFFYNKPPKIN